MAAFPDVEKIRFEGPKSKNMLAFHHYDEKEVVEGKPMQEPLSFCGGPIGTPFVARAPIRFGPRHDDSSLGRPAGYGRETRRIESRSRSSFMEKLGVHFYCFHDRDVAPEGKNLSESNRNLDAVVKVLQEEQQRTGIKLLWGTANLFQQSALRPRGGQTSLQCRRICLCGRPGERKRSR